MLIDMCVVCMCVHGICGVQLVSIAFEFSTTVRCTPIVYVLMLIYICVCMCVHIECDCVLCQLGFQRSVGLLDPDDHPELDLPDVLNAPSEKAVAFLKLRYSNEQAAALQKLYESDELFTGSAQRGVRRMLLQILRAENDSFPRLVSQYLQDGMSRGIPSLFSDLEPLYLDPSKGKLIGEIVEQLLSQLRSHNRFQASDAPDSESPATLVYALYYAAQHYDHLG